MGIFQGVMEEELERNLRKQEVFLRELEAGPKGYLSICCIGGAEYVYRKYREGNRVLSHYIGVPGSPAVEEAERQRERYLLAKRSLAELKEEEKRLRRALKQYAGIRK